MPFTLSHAAAVLPALRADGTGRARLAPAVLVAGSFAPDMTYFAASVLAGAMEFGAFTHSFRGVFTVDVLVAWALVGLWLLVREPLVALLPGRWQGRVAAVSRCGVPRARVRPSLVARWYASAALGALTHVVWDAFTHHDRWGVELFPVLNDTIAGSPLYWFLQYGSSAVGAVVIAGFVGFLLRRGRETGRTAVVPAGGVVRAPAGAPADGALRGAVGAHAEAPVGVPVLSRADRWWAVLVIGGCASVGAVERATRWWGEWGATAKPWELIPAVCFGAGAGLVPGLLVYVVGVRVWRPVPVPLPGREPVRPGRR